jgi:hypothetical protein
MIERTPEREKFLLDVLTTAVEHAGYGFFDVEEYVWDVAPREAYADIVMREDYEPEEGNNNWHLTIDTIATGLGIIRRAKPNADGVLTTTDGKILWFGGNERRALLAADASNGDEGDLDVIGALAVVECALFGCVVYA